MWFAANDMSQNLTQLSQYVCEGELSTHSMVTGVYAMAEGNYVNLVLKMKMKLYAEDDNTTLLAHHVERCGQNMLEYFRREAMSNMSRAAWELEATKDCPAMNLVNATYESGKLACGYGEAVSEMTGLCMPAPSNIVVLWFNASSARNTSISDECSMSYGSIMSMRIEEHAKAINHLLMVTCDSDEMVITGVPGWPLVHLETSGHMSKVIISGIVLQNGTVSEDDYIDCLNKFAKAFQANLPKEDLIGERMLDLEEEYGILDELAEPTLPVKYPRTPGWRPKPEDNPFNGW
ncbi:uncharacterized protein LOC106179617 [Lingula anatina]|uniref:Uncharacterized protein LOC106179617 n=1 Tax=Lingula anatina TaxID=7574 RepID=A0A1S3K8G2_LINAN|nr:uncharacterized protein LOC106179617 [Lingula anatina]|eukprot:XP_013418787.1 uncharacterized protein LOC106179617 [Lingula anatina]